MVEVNGITMHEYDAAKTVVELSARQTPVTIRRVTIKKRKR